MKIHTSRIKRHALLIFCTLTIALTFAATRLPLPGEVVSVVMVFIPTLVALTLTAMDDGRGGVRALLGKLAQWRVRPTWIVMALALGLVLRVTMSGIALLLGLIPTIQLRPWSPMQLALFAVMLFLCRRAAFRTNVGRAGDPGRAASACLRRELLLSAMVYKEPDYADWPSRHNPTEKAISDTHSRRAAILGNR